MAYHIVKNRTFITTATLMVPTDEGPLAQTLTARFKVLDGAEAMQVEDFLRGAILHLGYIEDNAGEAVPFSPALLEQIILESWARVGLIKAYWTAMAGGRVKN